MKGFIKKYAGLLSALALALTTLTVNSTCIYTMHQDKVPATAKKLRKF